MANHILICLGCSIGVDTSLKITVPGNECTLHIYSYRCDLYCKTDLSMTLPDFLFTLLEILFISKYYFLLQLSENKNNKAISFFKLFFIPKSTFFFPAMQGRSAADRKIIIINNWVTVVAIMVLIAYSITLSISS
jgi:hypothetical protein